MNIPFCKYQGTGNDFVLIDNRDGAVRLSTEEVAALCHRRFGIGADGLMLLEGAEGYDFRMVYYNSDGRESSMCGNGGRCIVAFAARLGLIQASARFLATDGPHEATIAADGTVSLGMQDVQDIFAGSGFSELNTGSPHHVRWVEDAAGTAVFSEGRRIRTEAGPAGINVNFVQRRSDGSLLVRTYERGVEDETLSCGTGVTAAAIAAAGTATGTFRTAIETPGGMLEVRFRKETVDSASAVVLSGAAVFVFNGEIPLARAPIPAFPRRKEGDMV